MVILILTILLFKIKVINLIATYLKLFIGIQKLLLKTLIL